MTAADLQGWLAYAELEPFGPLHDSRRAAVVALAALAPWQAKGEQVKPEDLFPELLEKEKKKRDDWYEGEDMILAAKMFAMAYGGEIK